MRRRWRKDQPEITATKPLKNQAWNLKTLKNLRKTKKTKTNPINPCEGPKKPKKPNYFAT